MDLDTKIAYLVLRGWLPLKESLFITLTREDGEQVWCMGGRSNRLAANTRLAHSREAHLKQNTNYSIMEWSQVREVPLETLINRAMEVEDGK